MHEQFNKEDVKYEDIDMIEEYLESKNELEWKNEKSKININTELHCLKVNKFV